MTPKKVVTTSEDLLKVRSLLGRHSFVLDIHSCILDAMCN